MTVLLAGLLAGCHVRKTQTPTLPCFLDPELLEGRVQRVLLVPLANETSNPAVSEELTRALLAAIEGKRLFNVTLMPPDAGGDEAALDPRRPLTLKDLARLRRTSGCDAALVGTVRLFSPYPRMRMSVSVRILDLRDSRVLWAVEHVWEAGDQETQHRMASYYRRCRGKDSEPLGWRIATVSPAAFEQFTAQELADTLLPPPPERPADELEEQALEKTAAAEKFP